MQLELIGPHPFERDAEGRQITRIGTIFPRDNTLWTRLPGVHAMQRLGFMEKVNASRAEAGQAPLTLEQEEELAANSVDLIFEPDHILIRPDPEHMDLAFAADELLQGLVSKRRVKFLSVADRRVREAIKHRGECWRLSSIPKTVDAKEKLVASSRVAVKGLPIYFYNRLTGTRWLTCQEFEGSANSTMPRSPIIFTKLRSTRCCETGSGGPRWIFLRRTSGGLARASSRASLSSSFPPRNSGPSSRNCASIFIRPCMRRSGRTSCAAKPGADGCSRPCFLRATKRRRSKFSAGLARSFFLQIEWLPGGRFEEGEFLFDSIFDEAANHPEDAELQRLCDPRAKGIIFNLIREYCDLEHINVGCLPESLSIDRPQTQGRRGVYLAEFHSRTEPNSIKRFMRLQKWGTWEHLDEGKDLLQSIKESEDYTDYWLDRRLGCLQLGMKLTRRVAMRRLTETYTGENARYRGESVRSVYFEREYLAGVASDKISFEKYARPEYALKLAALLGQAAVANMVVGHGALEQGTKAVFDDGDEVIHEGHDGLPQEIQTSDHSGAFGSLNIANRSLILPRTTRSRSTAATKSCPIPRHLPRRTSTLSARNW